MTTTTNPTDLHALHAELENRIQHFNVEDGALTAVPVWEKHRRGRNWLAAIKPNPTAPGGLERRFCPRAKGRYYYLVAGQLAPGDPIEFGGDYYTTSSRRNEARFYGVVWGISDDSLAIVETEAAKEAIDLAKLLQPILASEKTTTPLSDPIADVDDETLVAALRARPWLHDQTSPLTVRSRPAALAR